MRDASLGGLADMVHSLPQDAEELFHVMITYLRPCRWSILVWTLAYIFNLDSFGPTVLTGMRAFCARGWRALATDDISSWPTPPPL
jgi:hypothetical protein